MGVTTFLEVYDAAGLSSDTKDAWAAIDAAMLLSAGTIANGGSIATLGITPMVTVGADGTPAALAESEQRGEKGRREIERARGGGKGKGGMG